MDATTPHPSRLWERPETTRCQRAAEHGLGLDGARISLAEVAHGAAGCVEQPGKAPHPEDPRRGGCPPEACYSVVVSTDLTGMLRLLNSRGVSRLEHLEVLLLLSRNATANWDADRVAGSSVIPRATAVEVLAHLCRCELLEQAPGAAPTYRLGPRAEVPLLAELRDRYERDRISVMNAFYACNLESLRSFASAFRIRRPT